MSATGVKIFSNDMALDVKTDFVNLYGIGKTVEEIHDYMLESYGMCDDDEDACAFWSGLALIEWQYGVLTSPIKEKAEYIIKNHSDAPLFFKEKDKLARAAELKNLLVTINSENPSPKKPKKPFVYRTEWKQGDILAIQVSGKYVYFHVCAVIREKKKIEELESDAVYVRVFDVASDTLLEENYFKPRLFHRLKYKNISTISIRHIAGYEKQEVQQLWCCGIREQKKLESKIIKVGNVAIEYELVHNVSIDFGFRDVENTLAQLFGLN